MFILFFGRVFFFCFGVVFFFGGGGGGGLLWCWRFISELQVLVPVSTKDGIVALGKAHTRSAPSLSSVPKGYTQNSANVCVWLNTIPNLGARNVGRFLFPLLFPSGDQCRDALVCPCSEGTSSL